MKKYSKLNYLELYNFVQEKKDIDHYELIFYLRNMISFNYKIDNKYLRETNNTYFLTTIIDLCNIDLLEYYEYNKYNLKSKYSVDEFINNCNKNKLDNEINLKYGNKFFSSLLNISSELDCKEYKDFIFEINLFLRVSKEKDILNLIKKI